MIRATAVLVAAFVAASAVQAQTTAPLERDLLRLSELLGALHYLRPLCGAGEADTWRAKMAALLGTETGAPELRERMAGAFNRGYGTFHESYRTCTPRARLVAQRYLDEGAALAEGLTHAPGD